MSKQPVPYTLKPKRRRYWPWILLALLIALFVWWVYPRHYRIRDIASELDRTEPGWRYDELQSAKLAPPDDQNAIVFLKSLEDQLPASFAAAQQHIVKQASDWHKTREVSENVLPEDSVPEELAGIVEKTFKLRVQLPQLMNYSVAHYQRQPWDDVMLKGLPVVQPRLAEWWTLLITDLGESLRYNNQAAIELRTRLLFHHLIFHQLPCRIDYSQFARDFLFAGGQLERVLAKTTLSDTTLTELDRMLAQLDWVEIERKSLCFQRAASFEQTRVLLDRWQEVMDSMKKRSVPWYSSTYYQLAKDDGIEGGTLLMEYLQLRLKDIKNPGSESEAISAFIEKLKGFQHVQGDFWLVKAIKKFQNGGKIHAYYQIQLFESDRDTFRRAVAIQRILRTAIAVERYRHKTGDWPKTLAELVPGYMAAVPDDPFHPGKSLLIVPDSKGVRIQGAKHSDQTGLPTRMEIRLSNRAGSTAK